MLDESQIPNLKQRGNVIIGGCPACIASGGDRKGNHLWYRPDTEQYGCAAHQGDQAHWRDIFSRIGIVKELTPEQKQEWIDRKRREDAHRLIQAAQARTAKANAPAALEKRLRPYLEEDWYLEFLDTSPIRFHDEKSLRHEFLYSLFYKDDILWLGNDRYQSGKPHHAANFRTREDWMKLDELPPLISAGVFLPDSINRGRDRVELSPYIVIECDEIGSSPEENKKLSAALIAYAQKRLGLTLRAVIDTGNKSLHAWFDRPSRSAYDVLVRTAEHFRIDRGLLENCQHSPLRLPGAIHDKTNQPATLIYLNPITK